MAAIEICVGSWIPDTINAGDSLDLELYGLMMSCDDFDKIQIRRKGQDIFLDAFSKAKSSNAIGITTGWQKTIKIDRLVAGPYTLKFNHAFGNGAEWDRTVTVK